MAVAPTLWFDPLCKWGLVNFIFVTSKQLHYFPSLISWWGLLTNEVMPHLKRSYTKWIQQVHYFSSRECVKAVQWFASIAAQPLGLFLFPFVLSNSFCLLWQDSNRHRQSRRRVKMTTRPPHASYLLLNSVKIPFNLVMDLSLAEWIKGNGPNKKKI